MKKLIKLNAEVTKEMTFEEVLKRFKPMMLKEIHKHTSKVLFNAVEKEDLYQELSLSVWRAYEEYDIEKGCAFSTLLHNHLMDGRKRGTNHIYTIKRTAENGIYSLEEEIQEDETLLDVLEDGTNIEGEYQVKEMLKTFQENLTEIQLDVLEILKTEVDGSRGDITAFAKKWGFSRPTAYKRIKKIQQELQKFALEQGYTYFTSENKEEDADYVTEKNSEYLEFLGLRIDRKSQSLNKQGDFKLNAKEKMVAFINDVKRKKCTFHNTYTRFTAYTENIVLYCEKGHKLEMTPVHFLKTANVCKCCRQNKNK